MTPEMREIDCAVQQAIDDACAQGELTTSRARQLKAWWQEFVAAHELSSIERIKRLREIVEKGQMLYGDVPLIQSLKPVFDSIPRLCSECSGKGMKKCYKCNGVGVLYGDTPRGYVGMPIRSPCDACYGRGWDPCYSCGGKGILRYGV